MPEKATLDNIKIGDVVIDKDGNEHEITQEKLNRLLEYKRIKGNSPILGGKIIGKFIYYNNIIEKKKSKELELDEFISKLKALDETLDFKISVRGWCYLLENKRIVNKSEFKKLETKINKCRKNGLLPINFTAEDETRQFYNVEPLQIDYINPKKFIFEQIKDVKNLYHNKEDVSFWKFQKYYIQVIVEKGDLVNLFWNTCEKYHIPIANAKGRSDINQRNLLARRFKESEKKGKIPVLLYYSDFDPSGLQIVNDFKNNLKQIKKGTGWNPKNINIKRFGLSIEFIDKYNLTWINNLITGSGKNLTDPKHPDHNKPYVQDYIKKYGKKKCEANAILPIRNEACEHLESVIIKYLGKNCFDEYNKELGKNRKEVKDMLESVNFEKRINNIINDVKELEDNDN